MQVIAYTQHEEWNQVIKSFHNWDVYYLCEYVVSLMLHGDGKPKLVYFKNSVCELCYVVLEKDIAESPYFLNKLDRELYYDWETPYGYGGPLIKGIFDKKSEEEFFKQLEVYCLSNKIVSQFFRFHPILDNQKYMQNICEIKCIKRTVYMDLVSPSVIWEQMNSTKRNRIRNAEKKGIVIFNDTGERLEQFIKVYQHTMDKHRANNYYYFSNEYYMYLKERLKGNTIFFYSLFEGKIISAAMFLYNEQYMHYHLGGTLDEYKHLSSTDMEFYQAALWGCERKMKYLHLGGGVAAEDNLFRFKKKFNRNGCIPFYIGRIIFDSQAYQFLIALRKKYDVTFDVENKHCIQYRF